MEEILASIKKKFNNRKNSKFAKNKSRNGKNSKFAKKPDQRSGQHKSQSVCGWCSECAGKMFRHPGPFPGKHCSYGKDGKPKRKGSVYQLSEGEDKRIEVISSTDEPSWMTAGRSGNE